MRSSVSHHLFNLPTSQLPNTNTTTISMAPLHHHLLLLSLLLFLSLQSHVSTAGAPEPHSTTTTSSSSNPFTAKAALIRYWNRKIPNNQPQPTFFLSKLSPLSAPDSATFSTLPSISSHLPLFCSSAHLLCSHTLSQSLSSHPSDSHFAVYDNINFTNYGTDRLSGLDSFKNYSGGQNLPLDTFRRYSRDSSGHDDSFASYEPDGNVVSSNFTSYASSATGGSGDFTSYAVNGNVPNLKFTNYDSDAVGRKQSFTSYSDETNAGDQSFSSYGKHGDNIPTTFTSYGKDANVIGSTFSGYGEDGIAANDTFTSYGFNGNVPQNNFKAYGENGNGGVETFTSYRDQANVGDDSFQSYAKHGSAAKANFVNYGHSFNEGSDTFKGYGEESTDHAIGFKIYAGENTTFKDYAKTGVTFATYKNSSSVPSPVSTSGGGKAVNRWVEPGKFFRERNLKKGTVMPMPDIRDKMPERSFLPRSISEKLPFSAAESARIFQVPVDSGFGEAMGSTVKECLRAPSKGETKQCATSAEDMIDFAVSVLGNDIVVRSTANVRGSKGEILIGEVKGIDGGKVTKSVSCHQSLFPYLVYYCHSVPKVRVYEAEILDVKTKERINQGVAICHLDTSDWSAGHGAFLALGSTPGKIEVCHWIFEGDMTWAVADRPN